MKNLKLYALLFIGLIVLNSCKDEVEAPGTAYATFEANIGDVTVSPGGEFAKTINVYTANVTGADRTIELTVKSNTTLQAGAYTVPATVTIPANSNQGTIDVVLKDVGLDIIQDQVLGLSMAATADLFVGEDIAINVAKGCPTGESKLKIAVALDSYPEEVYWRIRNADTGDYILANSAAPGYGGYAGLSGTQRSAACLPAGNYLFQVYDQYGDGGGSIAITVEGVQIFSTNGAYGPGTDHAFTIQ